jgi:hypothetical protein
MVGTKYGCEYGCWREYTGVLSVRECFEVMFGDCIKVYWVWEVSEVCDVSDWVFEWRDCADVLWWIDWVGWLKVSRSGCGWWLIGLSAGYVIELVEYGCMGWVWVWGEFGLSLSMGWVWAEFEYGLSMGVGLMKRFVLSIGYVCSRFVCGWNRSERFGWSWSCFCDDILKLRIVEGVVLSERGIAVCFRICLMILDVGKLMRKLM